MTENILNLGYKFPSRKYSNGFGLNNSEMLFDKRIWRVGDVARFLNCTIGHVYNLASDEKIPKRKKNGSLFFVPSEILNWILEGD